MRKIKEFWGCRVLALDGDVGKVHDVYFNDVSWTVRYLVVDTGGWLSGRRVLISPQAAQLSGVPLHTVSVSLTRERIQASPDVDTDKPVSRQYESEFNRYYGYPSYWLQPGQWGALQSPPAVLPNASDALELAERRLERIPRHDTDLRSAREVSSYSVNAVDGTVGRVDDFVTEDETWVIRYLILETGMWLSGRQVLLDRNCVREVDWAAKCIAVDQTAQQIERTPAFEPSDLKP